MNGKQLFGPHKDSKTHVSLFTVHVVPCGVLYFFSRFYRELELPDVEEFHVVKALCVTVHFPASVLDLGTVKRPLVACLVGYVWVSELCVSGLNTQIGAFNTSILLTKDRDAFNLSSTLSEERLTCMYLI